MADQTWTSPVTEFHAQHVGSAPAVRPVTPDMVSRWQAMLHDVADDRREEVVGILEHETFLAAEIMSRPELVERFEAFLKNERAEWVGPLEAGDHVLSGYHHNVKRRVLGLTAEPAPTSVTFCERDLVALRLAHKAEIDAMRRELSAKTSELDDMKLSRDELAKERSSLIQELSVTRQKSEKNHENWTRTAADFENYQKRAKRDLARDREEALRKILGDLTTVIDNAVLVAENAAKPEATPASIATAVTTGVCAELRATLVRHGGSAMGVKPGDRFDPVRHQAVSAVDEEGEPEGESIASVVREGYLIGQAILRPAFVVVKRVKAPRPKVAESPTLTEDAPQVTESPPATAT